jgi:hypothetical protein
MHQNGNALSAIPLFDSVRRDPALKSFPEPRGNVAPVFFARPISRPRAASAGGLIPPNTAADPPPACRRSADKKGPGQLLGPPGAKKLVEPEQGCSTTLPPLSESCP